MMSIHGQRPMCDSVPPPAHDVRAVCLKMPCYMVPCWGTRPPMFCFANPTYDQFLAPRAFLCGLLHDYFLALRACQTQGVRSTRHDLNEMRTCGLCFRNGCDGRWLYGHASDSTMEADMISQLGGKRNPCVNGPPRMEDDFKQELRKSCHCIKVQACTFAQIHAVRFCGRSRIRPMP